MEEKKIQILKSCTELAETRVDSTLIFDGSVLHVYKDKIRLPDGKLSSREYMHHVGAVCVLPLTKEKEVICVRQYRYACSRVLLEIPAGKLDAPNEPHLEAAVRELREETGAVGATMTYLGPLLTSPALLDDSRAAGATVLDVREPHETVGRLAERFLHGVDLRPGLAG